MSHGSGRPTDLSSTIATGGTAQQLCAADPKRMGYRVMNLSSGNLFINDVGGTAVSTGTGSSFTLIPGAMYESPESMRPINAISIIGATTSQAFQACEW